MANGARRTGEATAREREMRRLVAAGERDGLTVRETAARAGMAAGTLAWWRSEIRRRDAVRAKGEDAPVFIEVVATDHRTAESSAQSVGVANARPRDTVEDVGEDGGASHVIEVELRCGRRLTAVIGKDPLSGPHIPRCARFVSHRRSTNEHRRRSRAVAAWACFTDSETRPEFGRCRPRACRRDKGRVDARPGDLPHRQDRHEPPPWFALVLSVEGCGDSCKRGPFGASTLSRLPRPRRARSFPPYSVNQGGVVPRPIFGYSSLNRPQRYLDESQRQEAALTRETIAQTQELTRRQATRDSAERNGHLDYLAKRLESADEGRAEQLAELQDVLGTGLDAVGVEVQRLAEISRAGFTGMRQALVEQTRVMKDILETLRGSRANESRQHFEEAMTWVKGDRPDKARDCLCSAVSTCSTNVLAHQAQGWLAIDDSRLPDALAHFRDGLGCSTTPYAKGSSYLGVAHAQKRASRPRDAADAAEAAVAAWADPGFRFQCAEFQALDGRIPRSLSNLRASIEANWGLYAMAMASADLQAAQFHTLLGDMLKEQRRRARGEIEGLSDLIKDCRRRAMDDLGVFERACHTFEADVTSSNVYVMRRVAREAAEIRQQLATIRERHLPRLTSELEELRAEVRRHEQQKPPLKGLLGPVLLAVAAFLLWRSVLPRVVMVLFALLGVALCIRLYLSEESRAQWKSKREALKAQVSGKEREMETAGYKIPDIPLEGYC